MGRPEIPTDPIAPGRLTERELEDIGVDEGVDLPSYAQSAGIPREDDGVQMLAQQGEDHGQGRSGRWGAWGVSLSACNASVARLICSREASSGETSPTHGLG